ncbi:unnamed protein product [Paramecium octaurelia]|uniref:non-specific serine/threonine protein kinase n=1 Tax=Paramecium octaurelia TaxID=43137 RepID=A0A8S1W3D8_PAROT|nr:unnamed protein product [Paramecium octaurelia]
MLQQFQELEKLGSGSFSEVWKVIRRADHQIYAMKKIKMGTLNEKEKQNALNKIRLLASLNQEFIIRYKEALYNEDTQTLGIIMEYAEGGDVAKQITNKQNQTQKFQEQEIWQALIQITQGLKELHEKLIFHRDIKSANIFISNGVYKLGDLNVSKIALHVIQFKQIETMHHQKFGEMNHMTINRISGHQGVFYMKCAICILHFKLWIWKACIKRFRKESALSQMGMVINQFR